MGGVEESWTAITAWLAEKVPRAVQDLRPPASDADIDVLETEVGSRLPDDLRTWLRLNDGMAEWSTFGRVLPPGHNPISCERMISTWRMWQTINTQAGEQRGCVGQWDPEAGGFGRPLWTGVGAMLADVARSVTTGVPVLGSYDEPRPPGRLGPMEPELLYEDDEWFHWE